MKDLTRWDMHPGPDMDSMMKKLNETLFGLNNDLHQVLETLKKVSISTGIEI